jgi:hypothetical protein
LATTTGYLRKRKLRRTHTFLQSLLGARRHLKTNRQAAVEWHQ